MSEKSPALFNLAEREGIKIVRFLDSQLIDDNRIREISNELNLIADQPECKLLLDMENVAFLASAMLGRLITIHRKMRLNNGKLAFCGIQENMFDTFRISKLDSYFEIYPDVDNAIVALR